MNTPTAQRSTGRALPAVPGGVPGPAAGAGGGMGGHVSASGTASSDSAPSVPKTICRAGPPSTPTASGPTTAAAPNIALTRLSMAPARSPYTTANSRCSPSVMLP